MADIPDPTRELVQTFTERFAPKSEPECGQFKQRLGDILELHGAVVGLEVLQKHMANLAGCVVLQKSPPQ